MLYLTLILSVLLYSPSIVLAKTNNTTSTTSPSPEKLFCVACSYEYTFEQLRNQSTWESPWSKCENQKSSSPKLAATACHTLLRIDYARQYVVIYYNASYLSRKKLSGHDHRIVLDTIMNTNGSRAQLKAFYECSFENNCHLPLDRFLQLQTALRFANYNYTNFIRRLNNFYNKPKTEVDTYFHGDTLTSTLNGYCGDMNRFDKESLKTLKPKCLKQEDKLKSETVNFDNDLRAAVYTCDGPQNTYCNSDEKLKKFLNEVTLTDYLQSFFGLGQMVI